MFDNVQEIWQRRSASSRAGLVFGVLLIAATLVWLSFKVLERDYQVLFSGLEPQDAATIVGELDKMKVPYRLGADETTVLVESSQVHATRLKLMGKGVNLRGGVGFEIFNNTDFGVTEFAQKINYQRALQGELARTIMALDAVKSARVHLVMPDSALFRRTTQKPKASIALALRDGRSLQSEQVLGIQRLVAASVPQIDASAVTVLDQRGVTLSRNVDPDNEDAAVGLGGKHDVETYLARKVVAVLDKTFGPGSAIVSVDVTLDHDQVRTTREDVLPYARGSTGSANNARAIVRSRSSMQATGANAVAATQAAAAADQPGPAPAQTAAPNRPPPAATTSEVEYQNGRVVEQTVSKPGGVRRISVGVMLPQALGADRLKELTQVLAMTVGLNRERGDEIAISSLDQFAAGAPKVLPPSVDAAAPQAAAAPVAAGGMLQRAGLPMLVALLLGLGLVAMLVAMAGARRKANGAPLSPDERDRLLSQMRQWLGTTQQRG